MPVYGLSYTDEQLFPLLNFAMPVWLLMAAVPRAKLTSAAVNMMTMLLCIFYALLLADMIMKDGSTFDMAELFSLQGIIQLFKETRGSFRWMGKQLWGTVSQAGGGAS